VIVPGEQSVKDIMNEVLDSHAAFKGDYDCIADYFNDADPLRSLFNFCKKFLPYRAEDEEDQTSRSPIAILMLADNWGVDCKHYSGFIAGVIDACNRAGYSNYDWCYRFASYDPFDSTKEHVFVVVNPGGNEIWLDPAPIEENGTYIKRSFNDRKAMPFYITDKILPMSLNRITGCRINPNYQSMGYISYWAPQMDGDSIYLDDSYTINTGDGFVSPLPQFDPGTPEAPIMQLPTIDPPYDPGELTYSPSDLNKFETVNTPPYIADYPVITGQPPISLPGTTTLTTPTNTTNTNAGLTTGFNIMTFIETNPVESILIGSAVVVGGILLFKASRKKKKQRQRA
jgi:hypothetical protein